MPEAPPSPTEMRHLRARNSMATLHLLLSITGFGGGFLLAAETQNATLYWVGQLILALAFIHGFILLHEAGHHTLFKQGWLNDTVGHLAGFVAMIPYTSWRPIHNRHHRYTGWQDLDATTASLMPHHVPLWQKYVIDIAWRYWLPLFSILYRLLNYWHLPRVQNFLGRRTQSAKQFLNAVILLFAYGALLAWFGAAECLSTVGPGLFLSLMVQDIILLSQHTRMPTNQSHGRKVKLFPPSMQSPFTRSLRLPSLFSWLIMHFDAHELHHMYPAVPGYLLRKIPYTPHNEVNWLIWIRDVKRVSGTSFLFGKHDKTEVDT